MMIGQYGTPWGGTDSSRPEISMRLFSALRPPYQVASCASIKGLPDGRTLVCRCCTHKLGGEGKPAFREPLVTQARLAAGLLISIKFLAQRTYQPLPSMVASAAGALTQHQ
jgi:hypothetical protein